MDQKRIFVSHSSQDNEFTKLLVAALRRAGADVWYDQDNLGAGVLRRKINDELATRPIVIVVISRAALHSTWVREECEWAYTLMQRDSGRVIIPVVAANYEPSDFNRMLFLDALRRIEASDHSPLPSSEAIARAVQMVGLPASPVVALRPQWSLRHPLPRRERHVRRIFCARQSTPPGGSRVRLMGACRWMRTNGSVRASRRAPNFLRGMLLWPWNAHSFWRLTIQWCWRRRCMRHSTRISTCGPRSSWCGI